MSALHQETKSEPRFTGWATVFTDASFCQQTLIGGWAAWVKYEGLTHRGSGWLREAPISSNEAEFMAACNGVFIAVTKFSPTTVHLVTDSRHVILALRGQDPTMSPRERKVLHQIRELTRSIQLRVKHVKGHTAGQQPRDHVNRWCDAEARRQMKMRRSGRG